MNTCRLSMTVCAPTSRSSTWYFFSLLPSMAFIRFGGAKIILKTLRTTQTWRSTSMASSFETSRRPCTTYSSCSGGSLPYTWLYTGNRLSSRSRSFLYSALLICAIWPDTSRCKRVTVWKCSTSAVFMQLECQWSYCSISTGLSMSGTISDGASLPSEVATSYTT
jgi:hypothetical protein